jgi:cardiolipin synthase (CMP-forming)
VHPNHLTLARFALLPALVALLAREQRGWALVVFLVAVATDFLDGALARRRDQVTNLGIVIDPLADKLVIGATLAMLGWQYLVIKIVVVALGLELVGVLAGSLLWMRRPSRQLPAANIFGKVKMVLQSIGGALFLLAEFLDLEALVPFSLGLLWAAILFAVLSLVRLGLLGRAGDAA